MADAGATFANVAGVAQSLRLEAAGLEVELDLRVERPDAVVERVACRAGLFASARRPQAAPAAPVAR